MKIMKLKKQNKGIRGDDSPRERKRESSSEEGRSLLDVSRVEGRRIRDKGNSRLACKGGFLVSSPFDLLP